MRSLLRRLAPAALLIPLLAASGAVSQSAKPYLERLPDAPPADTDAQLVPDAVLKTKLLTARVWVACQVKPGDRNLRNCTGQTSAPSDAGLSDAALAVAGRLAAIDRLAEYWGGGSKITVEVDFTREAAGQAFKVSYRFAGFAPLMRATRGPVPINLDDPALTPAFTAQPAPAEIDAAWPAAAKAAGISGAASLECRVKGDRLDGCKLFSVFPGGQGFEAAAMGLADRYRVAALLPAGLPKEPAFGQDNPLHYGEPAEGRRVRVGIQFGPDKSAAVPGYTADEAVVDIRWETGPTGDVMARYYPDRANRLEQAGRARLSCRLDDQGHLTDCAVEESPAGAGFGLAGLRVAQYFRASPASLSGRPVVGRAVHLPIYFSVPAD